MDQLLGDLQARRPLATSDNSPLAASAGVDYTVEDVSSAEATIPWPSGLANAVVADSVVAPQTYYGDAGLFFCYQYTRCLIAIWS